jgi:hypothetical protein
MLNFLRKLGIFDRRKSKRFELKSPIKCFCSYHLDWGEQNEYPALITNLSEEGVLLAVSKGNLPVRAEVEIRFQLPYHPEGILIHGIVLRSTSEGSRGFSYAAVKFKTQNELGIKMLMQYIPKKM